MVINFRFIVTKGCCFVQRLLLQIHSANLCRESLPGGLAERTVCRAASHKVRACVGIHWCHSAASGHNVPD